MTRERKICIGDWYRNENGTFYEVLDIYANRGAYIVARVILTEPGRYTFGPRMAVSRATLDGMEVC